MDSINLDTLLEERKPLTELMLKGVKYPVYAYEHLSVGVTARVSAVNAEFEAINEEIRRECAIIDPQIDALREKSDSDPLINTKLSRLYAARIAHESKLLKPTRELVEAIAGMPSGSLSELPPKALQHLFTEVNEKVFSSLGKQKEVPETSSEKQPTTSEP